MKKLLVIGMSVLMLSSCKPKDDFVYQGFKLNQETPDLVACADHGKRDTTPCVEAILAGDILKMSYLNDFIKPDDLYSYVFVNSSSKKVELIMLPIPQGTYKEVVTRLFDRYGKPEVDGESFLWLIGDDTVISMSTELNQKMPEADGAIYITTRSHLQSIKLPSGKIM